MAKTLEEMMSLEFELVFPCYNESKSIEILIRNAVEAAKKAGYTSQEVNFVLVENGSKDDSKLVMQALSQTELGNWFKVIYVDTNEGYGNGITAGLRATTAPFVGWSHADQQCHPQDAFIALSKVKRAENRQILVKGVRTGRDFKDRAVSRIFELIARIILGVKLYEINAQPKVFPRNLLTEIKNPPKDFAFDLYVLYCAKQNHYQIETIPVKFPNRIFGVSNWASTFLSRYKTIFRMIGYMLRLARSTNSIALNSIKKQN